MSTVSRRPSELPSIHATNKQLSAYLQACVDKQLLKPSEKDELQNVARRIIVETESVPLEDLTPSCSDALEVRRSIDEIIRKRQFLVNSDEFRAAHPECVHAAELAEKVM